MVPCFSFYFPNPYIAADYMEQLSNTCRIRVVSESENPYTKIYLEFWNQLSSSKSFIPFLTATLTKCEYYNLSIISHFGTRFNTVNFLSSAHFQLLSSIRIFTLSHLSSNNFSYSQPCYEVFYFLFYFSLTKTLFFIEETTLLGSKDNHQGIPATKAWSEYIVLCCSPPLLSFHITFPFLQEHTCTPTLN